MSGYVMQFVLLEHTTEDGVHWDLMVETAAPRLKTWRLLENPIDFADAIAATPLPDHRRDYLSYEGPVSGQRGTVRRLDRGAARIDAAGPVHKLALNGEKLTGSFEIKSTEDGAVLRRLQA
jgi:hypothetical protein